MVNGTLLNFGKRYKDNLKVIFDQWAKLQLGLDALSNQEILNGIYWICIQKPLSRHLQSFRGRDCDILNSGLLLLFSSRIAVETLFLFS